MKPLLLLLAIGLQLGLATPIPPSSPYDHHMPVLPRLRNSIDRIATLLAPLSVLCCGPRLRPVFDIDSESSEFMADANGDVLLITPSPKLRLVAWNPSGRLFYSVPDGRPPVAILVFFLWLLASCWYFARPLQQDVHDAESANPSSPTSPDARREKSRFR
ncbi:hypothetical protein GQ602_000848 [Ophiocordyceps camponoti-floridani]|uniref:Uncharacterized protein n=1 Tax=Ophiocordyceps camponoti-floridani TaxID=2030778 RepID=A0A8H4QCW4_9HYPO|nr:hypothetical protein GQ602_000848 [Ophiocordyceps camponoti-floridani]